MSFSSFLSYLQALSPSIPSEHWWIIVPISFAITISLLAQKEVSVYGIIAVELTVLLGLFLFDALALKRLISESFQPGGIDFKAEYQRIVHGSKENRLLLVFNFLVFVPMGILLSESVLVIKSVESRHCLLSVLLITFGLSLCVELLQLIFHVGFFEMTDLFLNTLGAGTGSCMALWVRRILLLRDNQ